MARLNVEPEFFADSRFLDLVSLTSDKEKAVGMVVLFWMLAQKFWANGRELVPLEVFKRHKWELLVDIGLAEIRKDGVYAKGSDQFEWILERKEAGKRGGNKSAELRSSKRKQTQANASKSNPLLCSTAATALLKKNIYKKKKPKPLCKEWPANHVYAKSFANLNRIDSFAKVFDLNSDESRINRYLEEYKLSASEMEEITFTFAEWADGPLGENIKSPRGTLATFVRGYVKRRNENPTPLIKEPKYIQPGDVV